MKYGSRTIILEEGAHRKTVAVLDILVGKSLGIVRIRMVRMAFGKFLGELLLIAFYRWKQAVDPRLAGLNTLQFSVWFSRGAGLVLAYDGALILLPMCRNILRVVRPKLRWLPLDESQWFHRQTAYAMLLFTIIHTTSHYVK